MKDQFQIHSKSEGTLMQADDMLSLRNFYVYIITLWSSQGNLNSKKSKKMEEKGQVTKTCHVG